jgi:hypothetical protein
MLLVTAKGPYSHLIHYSHLVSKNCLSNVPLQEGTQCNMNRATMSRNKNGAAVA